MSGILHRFIRPWRLGLGLATAVGIIWIALLACSWTFAPDGDRASRSSKTLSDKEQAIVDARTALPDLDHRLVLWQDVDYSRGPDAPWYPKGESPVLHELVQEGRLPPVAERVGSEPAVIRGVDGIGRYGGVCTSAMWSPNHINWINLFFSYCNLARWSPDGYPVVPHVAKGWEVNADHTVFTVHLRKGMRWSDGYPFTADDIMYWYEYEVMDPIVGASAGLLEHVGGTGTVRKLDDYTVQFVFDRPNGLFIQRMAYDYGYYPVGSPRHYLMQYHPRVGNKELIAKMCRRLGLPSALALYQRLKRPENPEHPRLWPWIVRSYRSHPPYAFVRNPYYFAVDEQGNQLPYIDRLYWKLKSPELLGIAAANGELTFQPIWPPLNQYTLLMSNRQAHDYDIRQWYPAARSTMVINPNLNRRIVPGDPASRWKKQLLTDKRFRQALSLAINRQAIIDTAFLGLGEPSQLEPGPGSPFHSEKLARAFIDYAPERANALLDEIGLTQRDGEGMRTFPDGTRMEFYIDTIAAQDTGAIQMVVDDWARVGVRSKIMVRSQALWRTEIAALIHDFSVAESLSEFIPTNDPHPFVPWGLWCDYAQGYAAWYQRGGMWGDPRALKGGTPGPPKGSPMYQVMELFNEVRQAPTVPAQAKIFDRILDLNAENLWTISIASPPPYLVLVKNGMKNVPRFAVAGNHQYTPGSTGLETYYFEHPGDTPASRAQLKAELATPGHLPGGPEADAAQSTPIAAVARTVLTWIAGLAAAIVVLTLVLRHPFVARRLAIMVPTLVVISVLTFIIVQLPPGDYLTTLIMQRQEEGGEAAEAEIREFRKVFHLDESPLQQYLRWSGLTWFTTFSPGDRGLLQGNLGRSMQTLQPVNRVVGDRILLTVLISAGTILFTWLLAIPIGIYSAVRQYSPGDYLATFVGLVGMSVPNFLLAILAMFLASRLGNLQVTGLFSAEYGVQAQWDWPKIHDLLRHIWLPVLVLGIGGTANMVRIMRGNLLDELNRPYVRTARAKGMRPWRLILKYPVRLALNPFVSGLGTLFPQLISGGAITAVILSLPTVGPLMLEAFRSQDMYLAGSMLLVLSFLGIVGTLVSDLILIALDPRIRMETRQSR